MPFMDYDGTDLVPYILPIIPVGAPLSPRSKLTPDRIGRIPGPAARRWVVWLQLAQRLGRRSRQDGWADGDVRQSPPPLPGTDRLHCIVVAWARHRLRRARRSRTSSKILAMECWA